MKQLLGMAREKKDKQPLPLKQPMFQNAPQKMPIPSKNAPQQQSPPSQSASEDQFQEPGDEEIILFAQYLGIQLPEEEDLLYLAREGLMAELPPDWTTQEDPESGQIIYINERTGEQTQVHPCDEYYKRLVIEERKKKHSKKGSKIGGGLANIGSLGGNAKGLPRQSEVQPIQIQQIQIPQKSSVSTDPLLRLQQEKQVKKLEEQKKKEFQDKKLAIISKYQNKKEQLGEELRSKEERIRNKYLQEEKAEKSKKIKALTDKQRQHEEMLNKQLSSYEKDQRSKIQKQYSSKRGSQRAAVEQKIRQKKEQIRLQLEQQLRKAKKQIDEQYRSKNQLLQQKQKQIVADTNQLEYTLEGEMKRLKEEIVRKKMRQHGDKIKLEGQKQKQLYNREVQKLQSAHEAKISQLQQKQPKSKVNMTELISECQNQQKQELATFQYELKVLKQTKKIENELKLEELKMQMVEEEKRVVDEVIRQKNGELSKYRNARMQDIQRQIWQAQKTAKEQFLRALKSLQKKYHLQEEIVRSQNVPSLKTGSLEAASLMNMESMVADLTFQEKELRKQLDRVRLQVENLRSQGTQVGLTKMSEQQRRLFDIIEGKVKQGIRK